MDHTRSSRRWHILIFVFPYSMAKGKDDKCRENKQFHKKHKSIPPRIPLQLAIDHLLSQSKCSKRYLSAYCLNLHQLTTAEHLLQCIFKKCTFVIKQLRHIMRSEVKFTDLRANTLPTPAAPGGLHYDKFPRDCAVSVSQPPSPVHMPRAPVHEESGSPSKATAPSLLAVDGVAFESRSCPELDIGCHGAGDADRGTPPLRYRRFAESPSIALSPRLGARGRDGDGFRGRDGYGFHAHSLSRDSMESAMCALSPLANGQHDGQQHYGQRGAFRPFALPASFPAATKNKESAADLADDGSPRKAAEERYRSKMSKYCVATIKHNIDVLYHWIYYYPEDFAEGSLRDQLTAYISKVRDSSPGHHSVVRRCHKLLQLIQHRRPAMKHQSVLMSSISHLRVSPKVRTSGRKTSFQFTDSFFPPREMVEKLGGSEDLLKMHPHVVAAQLTLIDAEIFLQIQPRELTNQSWQKRPDLSEAQLLRDDDDGDEGTARKTFDLYEKLQKLKIEAPNLLYMIDHVNRLSLWVATEILSRSTTAEMVNLTKFFYVVASHCLELCNVHTAAAIFGGISLQPLTRLRRLKRYLSEDEQIQNLHAKLSNLVNGDLNYKAYRQFMERWHNDHDGKRQRPGGAIPFIPVLVKDLFNIQLSLVQRVKVEEGGGHCRLGHEDGRKHVDLGLLEKNCRQIRRVYETQQRAKLYGNTLPRDTDIQSTLKLNIAKFETHDTLRAWSFEIQPKLTREDKENLEMIDTLEEFGFL